MKGKRMLIQKRLRDILVEVLSSLNEKNSIAGLTFVFEDGDSLVYQFYFNANTGKYAFLECVSRFGLKSQWDSVQEAADRTIESVSHLKRRVDCIAHVTTLFINKRENVLGEGSIWVFKGRVNVSNKAVATLYGFSECVAMGNAKVTAHDRSKVWAFDEVRVHLIEDYASAQLFHKAQSARHYFPSARS